jgi:citrate synthase
LTVYLSAQEAAARLGVSRQTLYAYVSRGMLSAHTADDPRQRRYEAQAVDRLAATHRSGRRPREVAKATLDFGLPVLESAITLIRDGSLWYRGVNALTLAEKADLEDVAALLWSMPRAAAFGSNPPNPAPLPPDPAQQQPVPSAHRDLLTRFAALANEDETAAWVGDPARLAAGCGAIVRLLVTCITGQPPTAEPIHHQCANAWGLDTASADLVRKTLILCADHELNASGFTVRCVASTGASLRSAIIAGLAALSGPLHGGATARIEALWDALETASIPASLRSRLAAGEDLPGFALPGG